MKSKNISLILHLLITSNKGMERVPPSPFFTYSSIPIILVYSSINQGIALPVNLI